MNERMKELDDELATALRREEPPAGFADRVLSRVAEQAQDPRTWSPSAGEQIRLKPDPTGMPIRLKPDPTTTKNPVSFLQWAAAAALVAAMWGGFGYIARQKERAEGEAAGARVTLALQITSSKLQLVQTKINRLHQPPERNTNQ
jgi:hypothetical protein